MDAVQLKYYVEVIESGSISKAAANLYVSQPNLSRVMHALEEEMGQTLLVRGNRGIKATRTGEQLYYYARSLLSQFQLLEQLKSIDSKEIYRKLAVSVNAVYLQDDLMVQYFKQMGASRTEIQLNETTAEAVIEDVMSLRSELGILVLNTYQYGVFKKIMDIKEISHQEIAKSPLRIHVSKYHPLATKPSVHAKELLTYPYLHYQEDFYHNLNLPIIVDEVGVKSFAKEIIMNNYHSLLNVLNHTDAFILGHDFHKNELTKSNVSTLELENSDIVKHLILIHRKKQMLSEEAERFIETFLKGYQ